MGEYVSDAERAQMEALAAEREDAPIEDPAERAETVAKELRRRGLWAYEELRLADRSRAHGPPPQTFVEIRAACGAVSSSYDVSTDDHATKGPRAIAALIQAEEAKRAQEWAGDL